VEWHRNRKMNESVLKGVLTTRNYGTDVELTERWMIDREIEKGRIIVEQGAWREKERRDFDQKTKSRLVI